MISGHGTEILFSMGTEILGLGFREERPWEFELTAL